MYCWKRRAAIKFLPQTLSLRTTVLLIFALAGALLLRSNTANAQDADNAAPSQDYADELPRFEPLSPMEAVDSFEILDGFSMELVASEPLVEDPIAFAFDASSRLFVVEMRGYSEQPDENLGRIALLTDTDGDGHMDQRTTFVDNLSWPTAIWPWRDGAIVAEPPKLTWYRDRDGDGVSDESEEWFEGFGRSNVQGMVNSLRWGVDGLLHGATSSTGAELQQIAADQGQTQDQGQTLDLRRRDFAIDTVSKLAYATSGGGQHGLSFNRWGDKFVTSNSDHLQQVIDFEQWLTNHPASVRFPSFRRSIAVDGPQAEVFRSSPVEPWRIVRTRLRVGGVVSGPVEGGGRAAGYFTGATGTWIVDPTDGVGYQPNSESATQNSTEIAIVCDVGSNLIHRKSLTDDGIFWKADRLDPETELVRSSDTWFRPVQLGDGPDGSVYIADMYREVIEHPKSLPPMIKQHLDLTSGRDRGRIWRLRRTKPEPPSPTKVDMREFAAQQLVLELSSPIAWRRRTASQLLIERGNSPQVRSLLQNSYTRATPEGKILAMHVANRLGFFDADTAREGIQDPHPRVAEHAIRLARTNQLGNELKPELEKRLEEPEPRIALELAAISPDLDIDWQEQVVAALLPRATQPLLQSVLATSEAGVRRVLRNAQSDPSAYPLVTQSLQTRFIQLLLPVWLETAQRNRELGDWLLNQMTSSPDPTTNIWLNTCSEPANLRMAQAFFQGLDSQQKQRLHQSVLSGIAKRKTDWIALLPVSERQEKLNQLLDSSESAQETALSIAERNLHADLGLVLSHWDALSQQNKPQAIQLLGSVPQGQNFLLSQLQSGKLPDHEIPNSVQSALRNSRDKSIRSRAVQLLGELQTDRGKVVKQYSQSIAQLRNTRAIDEELLAKGKEHFRKACSQCHQLDGIGQNVGAGLKQLSDKTPEQLVSSILDPNREVDPRFVSYTMLLETDQAIAGLIESENSQQVVLVEAGGKKTIVPRNEIAQLTSHGKSLMPVGFEDQLSPEAMFELICFLREARLKD